jgi:heterodisulfide reductase subunit A
MVSVGQHENIELLSYSEVEEVSGYVGNFQVQVRKKARYVNEDLCTGCGLCEEKCPARKIPSEFNLGLGTRKAIYRPFAQAVPNIPVLDPEHCIYFLRGKCRACEKLCPRQAIDFEQQDRIVEFDVGTIILATGYDLFDPSGAAQFGYGLDNVLTGMELERLISADGPTGGKVVLKDGTPPRRMAILHCVGSRDEQYHEYCSRVCCMVSLKLAHLVKEATGAEVYEVYRDMRAFGKGYEEFYERIQEEGVIMVRGRGTEVAVEKDGRLTVKAEDTNLGRPVSATVDMVILGTGITPRPDAATVAQTFGISRSPDGFFMEAHPKLRPFHTNTDGVFLAGACQAPRDIPDTVAHATAAAAEALVLMDTGVVTISPTTATVIAERCVGCGDCVVVCPYTAISLVEGKAEVNSALCKGCGTCAAACPAGAIKALHFTDEQIVAQIEGVLAWL